MRRCAIFADENVLHNHNCSRSEEFVDGFESQKSDNDRLISDRYEMFCNGSWTIKSFHSNILNEHETSAMTKELKAYIVINIPRCITYWILVLLKMTRCASTGRSYTLPRCCSEGIFLSWRSERSRYLWIPVTQYSVGPKRLDLYVTK